MAGKETVHKVVGEDIEVEEADSVDTQTALGYLFEVPAVHTHSVEWQVAMSRASVRPEAAFENLHAYVDPDLERSPVAERVAGEADGAADRKTWSQDAGAKRALAQTASVSNRLEHPRIY